MTRRSPGILRSAGALSLTIVAALFGVPACSGQSVPTPTPGEVAVPHVASPEPAAFPASPDLAAAIQTQIDGREEAVGALPRIERATIGLGPAEQIVKLSLGDQLVADQTQLGQLIAPRSGAACRHHGRPVVCSGEKTVCRV